MSMLESPQDPRGAAPLSSLKADAIPTLLLRPSGCPTQTPGPRAQ